MKTIIEDIKDYWKAWFNLAWLIMSVLSLINYIEKDSRMAFVFIAIVPMAIIESIRSLRKATKP